MAFLIFFLQISLMSNLIEQLDSYIWSHIKSVVNIVVIEECEDILIHSSHSAWQVM